MNDEIFGGSGERVGSFIIWNADVTQKFFINFEEAVSWKNSDLILKWEIIEKGGRTKKIR